MTEEIPPSGGRTARATLPALLPLDFRAFHQMQRPAYVRWAEYKLGNRSDAEEAVDQAFVELAENWPLVLRHEKPAAYAWTVVKHRTIDAGRAGRRRRGLIDTAAFETVALHRATDPLGQLEDSLATYAAIRSLPERQHDVIVHRYCLGHSVSETADILGISEAGVRSTARYAKKNLARALQQEGVTDGLAD
ncbi:RNA polymerase sigma factor [Streptomyces tardus]|nr:sigma-70 family RNA polymerase sigma factor [Streptomyces tardus]